MLNTEIAPLDAILETHAAVIGRDLVPYRNHTYRMANFCLSLVTPTPEATEKIGIAAAFHDLGIWTDHTFDYLLPSVALAKAYLCETGRGAWEAEIAEMILQHHKITRYAKNPAWLVEPFRRADWIDVTRGVLTYGVSRALIRQAYATWPDAGFHLLLVKLELGHVRRHPLNPLPVLKL